MKTNFFLLNLIFVLATTLSTKAQTLTKTGDFTTDKLSKSEKMFVTDAGMLVVLLNNNAITNSTIFEVVSLGHDGKFLAKSEFKAGGDFSNYAYVKCEQLGNKVYVALGRVQGGTAFNSNPVLIAIDKSGAIEGPAGFEFQPKEIFRTLNGSPNKKRMMISTDKRWVMVNENLEVQWEIIKKDHDGRFDQTGDWCINDNGAMAYLNAPKSGRKKGIIQTEIINSKGEFLAPVIWEQKVDDDDMPYYGNGNLIVGSDGSFVLVTSTLGAESKESKMMEYPTDLSILILNPETGEKQEILHHQYGINNAGVMPRGRTTISTAYKSDDGIWYFNVWSTKPNVIEYWTVNPDGSVNVFGGKQRRKSSLSTYTFDHFGTGFSGFFSESDKVDMDFIGKPVDIQAGLNTVVTNAKEAKFHMVFHLNGKLSNLVPVTQFTTDDMYENTGERNFQVVHNPKTNVVTVIVGKASKGTYQVYQTKL